MRATYVLSVLPLLLAPILGQGDDSAVLAAIDKGREAVKSGKAQEAVEHLQRAIGLLQAMATKGLASFLPTRDEKVWEMGEVESQNGNWGAGEQAFQWSQVTRRYTKKETEGGPEVTVMISNSPQIIQAQRASFEMFKDPAMRAMMNRANPDQKVEMIEEGEWLGILTTEKESSTALVLHKTVMVQIDVQQGDDKLAKEFWAAIPKAGLAAGTK